MKFYSSPPGGDNSFRYPTTAWVQGELTSYAPKASPALTGTPTGPTASNGTNTTQLATCAFVLANAATNPMTTAGDIIYGETSGVATRLGANSSATKKYLQSVSSGNPSWVQIAAADLSDGTTGSGTIALSASPALTGTPTVPTASLGTNTTQAASCAFVLANNVSMGKSLALASGMAIYL